MKLSILLIFCVFTGTVFFNQTHQNTNQKNNRQLASIEVENERTPNSLSSCQYQSKDIGLIQGFGSDIHKARSAASKICFEKRVDLFEKSRSAFPSTEQGQLIIDSCVNIRCK